MQIHMTDKANYIIEHLDNEIFTKTMDTIVVQKDVHNAKKGRY